MTAARRADGRAGMVFDDTLLVLLPKDERLNVVKSLHETGASLLFVGLCDLRALEPELETYFDILEPMQLAARAQQSARDGALTLYYVSSNKESLLLAKNQGCRLIDFSVGDYRYHLEILRYMEGYLKSDFLLSHGN